MLHERFKGLGEQFLQRTREDLQAMQQCLRLALPPGVSPGIDASTVTPGIQAATSRDAACAELRHLAHRVCGSAAMLGFADISDCAGCIERLLRASPDTGIDWPAVQHMLQQLAERVSRTSQNLSSC